MSEMIMDDDPRQLKRARCRDVVKMFARSILWLVAYSFWRCSCSGTSSPVLVQVAAFESRTCRPASHRLCFLVGGDFRYRISYGCGNKAAGSRRHLKKNQGRKARQRTVVQATTRGKRGASGRPLKRNGVGKKVRRILEPASLAEVAEEKRKDKVSVMNWGRLGRKDGGGGGGQGRASQGSQDGRREGRGAAMQDRNVPWKEIAPPRGGDLLQCKHFKVCPGCEFDRRFDETPIMVDSSSFMNNLHAFGARVRGESNAGSSFERHVIHPWDPHGWRTVAKLAVRPVSRWGGVELGLYQLGSHDVVGIPQCRVHHPSVNLAMDALQAAAKKVGVTGFRQENFEGDLRYVQVAVERKSGQVQLTLVWNEESYGDATPKLQLLAKDLRSRKPDLFHSIWANFRVGPGNAIFSRDQHSWHRCSGPEFLRETIGPNNIPFFFSPPLFRQANLDHFESIVKTVVDWVPEGSGVCELYAGVGVLGLNCASKARFVRCSDVNSFNPRSFERSRKWLPPEQQRRVSYEVLSAAEALEDGEADDCEVLIVDPPRKGLDHGVLAALKNTDDPGTATLRRIVYVSCGFDALKRDASSLVDAGWTLRHSEGFVLFPGSDHIETLAIFDR